MQDKRWRRMLRPGITAIVGAGGKTTVLSRLALSGREERLPIMISATVDMDCIDIDGVEPFDVICTDDIEKGEAFCVDRIHKGHVPAWFRGLNENDQYMGLDPQTIDMLKQHHPAWYIVVEGDKAEHKWLKAPLADDIPLPATCDAVIGVVNLQMLGHALSKEKVEGVETEHPRGMFRGVQCAKILFCTGYNAVQHRMTEALLDDLEDFGLTVSVLADGYRQTCKIRQYIYYDATSKQNI